MRSALKSCGPLGDNFSRSFVTKFSFLSITRTHQHTQVEADRQEPKRLTEKRFREHFSSIGEVTDAKLMKSSYVYLLCYQNHISLSSLYLSGNTLASQRMPSYQNSRIALLPDSCPFRFGNSRRFGFIGYRTEKDAKTALAHFNNTFVDTSKIVVEKAKEVWATSPEQDP